jgi:hypothetical protein
MKSAEWINLISNDKDKKFARAACAEILDEASSQQLMDILKSRRPKCAECKHDGVQDGLIISPMPGMNDGCDVNCGWMSFFADLFVPRRKK